MSSRRDIIYIFTGSCLLQYSPVKRCSYTAARECSAPEKRRTAPSTRKRRDVRGIPFIVSFRFNAGCANGGVKGGMFVQLTARRKPDHVSRRVNMRCGSPVMFVDMNQTGSPTVTPATGRFSSSVLLFLPAATRTASTFNTGTRGQLESDSILTLLGAFQRPFLPVKHGTVAFHRAAQSSRNLGVEERQRRVATSN